METNDLSCTWNIWVNEGKNAQKNVVPIAIIYSPLAKNVQLVQQPALECARCRAVLHPGCSVDLVTRIFVCSLCGCTNSVPAGLDTTKPVSETTLEYEIPMKPYEKFILFVIDTAAEDLEHLKTLLLQAIMTLPGNINVGIITYAKHVYVYDMHAAHIRRFALQGEGVYTSRGIADRLRVDSAVPSSLKRFFISAADLNVAAVIESFEASLEKVSGLRPERCSGTALKIATEVIKMASFSKPARVVMFVAGAATVGNGAIVGRNFTENIRHFGDIVKESASYLKPAKLYYDSIAKDLVRSGHSVDIIACSIDQCGLYELEQVCQTSGGSLLEYDSYRNANFKQNLLKLLSPTLQRFSECSFSVNCSPNIKICGLIGPGFSHNNSSSLASSLSIGLSNSNSWGVNSIDEFTAFTVFFHPIDKNTEDFSIQLQTRYLDNSCNFRVRVKNCRFRAQTEVGFEEFDQETAAVVTAKLAVWRLVSEGYEEVVRWVDQSLVSLVRRFSIRNGPEVVIPSQVSLFPQFIYYFRRSNFLNRFNVSPDDSAVYRQQLLRSGVVNSLLMIQPVLLSYSFASLEPVPKILSFASMKDEAILMLDSFFNVVVWYGKTVLKWKQMEYQLREEHSQFKKLLELPLQDAESIKAARFPVPRVINCGPGGTDERFIKARLDTQPIAGGDSLQSEVISLEGFLQKLKTLVKTT